MVLALILLTVISFLELMLWIGPVWKWRRPLAGVLIVALSVANSLLVSLTFHAWSVLILMFSIYRIINLLRVVESRMQADYLYHATRNTSLYLLGVQVIILGITFLNYELLHLSSGWLYFLIVLQGLLAMALFASTNRHLRTTRPVKVTEAYTDKELPSVTVAIPARNETADLEACLESLLSSTYKKLEILVLDDCSQNKRTPEIIRNFAHDGVRFMAGEVPPDSWLAKNYAYKQLADEANGAFIVFCGVDARFEPDTIKKLVINMLEKKKTMISLIPKNIVPDSLRLQPLMVQPARYAWELALPRRWFNRPPVLSTCWIVTRDTLRDSGGFESVSRSSSVESYFAKYALRHGDGYSFMQATDTELPLKSMKTFEAQRATAIRTRYPQLHKRPELVALVSLIELGLLAAPFAAVVLTIFERSWILAGITIATSLLLITFYSRIVTLTYRHFLLHSLWLLPVAVVYDICLLNYSMWQYEFSEVIWKGRNVCMPVMHVVPHLPSEETAFARVS